MQSQAKSESSVAEENNAVHLDERLKQVNQRILTLDKTLLQDGEYKKQAEWFQRQILKYNNGEISQEIFVGILNRFEQFLKTK